MNSEPFMDRKGTFDSLATALANMVFPHPSVNGIKLFFLRHCRCRQISLIIFTFFLASPKFTSMARAFMGKILANITLIRKDCFQVKSNLLTDSRFTTHMNIMILN